MNDYITLSNSNDTLVKRYRIIASGYGPRREKTETRRVTVTGKIDNQVGPVLIKWHYVLRAYEADPTDPSKSDSDTTGYGTLAHLKTFFDYDEPEGTPSNVVSLKDLDYDETAVEHSIYLTGALTERNLGPSVSGTSAAFDVPIEMARTT